jgi:hypothetical protein
LALFRAAAKQDDKCLAVLAEVNAVAGAELELVFEHSGTDALDIREITERDPVTAVAIFAAASVFRLSNHAAYGLRPLVSRYSRTPIIRYGNIIVTIVNDRISATLLCLTLR